MYYQLSVCAYTYSIWIGFSTYVSESVSNDNEALYVYVLCLFIYSDSKYSLSACYVPVLS